MSTSQRSGHLSVRDRFWAGAPTRRLFYFLSSSPPFPSSLEEAHARLYPTRQLPVLACCTCHQVGQIPFSGCGEDMTFDGPGLLGKRASRRSTMQILYSTVVLVVLVSPVWACPFFLWGDQLTLTAYIQRNTCRRSLVGNASRTKTKRNSSNGRSTWFVVQPAYRIKSHHATRTSLFPPGSIISFDPDSHITAARMIIDIYRRPS